MNDVDFAIARAESEAARYSDSAWVDRRILASEVKRLRARVAAVQQLATVARQEHLPVPADLILDRLASSGEEWVK